MGTARGTDGNGETRTRGARRRGQRPRDREQVREGVRRAAKQRREDLAPPSSWLPAGSLCLCDFGAKAPEASGEAGLGPTVASLVLICLRDSQKAQVRRFGSCAMSQRRSVW